MLCNEEMLMCVCILGMYICCCLSQVVKASQSENSLKISYRYVQTDLYIMLSKLFSWKQKMKSLSFKILTP